MRSIEQSDNGTILIVEVNLKQVSSINAFFNKMKTAFELPSYFSDSLDSLDECMRDLSWISEPNIKMIISNTDALKEKNNKLYNDIQECFLTYKEYWDNVNIKKTKNVEILL